MGFFNRPFRRRPFPVENLPPVLMARLTEANRLAEAGQYDEAAQIFARLAHKVGQRGHPQHAANLHARAAHLFTDGGDGTAALAQARIALHLFLQMERVRRVEQFYTAITRHLRERGLEGEAEVLQEAFGSRLKGSPQAEGRVEPEPPQGYLPSRCPQCGAPLRSDEVEWVDEVSAVCGYCGGVVRREPAAS
jgi:hypothetical protein